MVTHTFPINTAVLSAVRHAAGYVPLIDETAGIQVSAIFEEPDAPGWAIEAGRALAQKHGLPFSTEIDRIDGDDIGCVLVCSEPTRHARLTETALEAGKHVLVDKPMATTLEDAERLIRVTDSATGHLSVIHRLYAPEIQRARTAINSGGIGLVRSADLEWLATDGLSGATVEMPELVADPALSGGGEMMNFLMYPVSTLRYLVGAEVLEVFAETDTFFFEPHRSYGVEDIGILSLKLEHDIIATITVGRVPQAPSIGHGTASARLIGSHGHLVVDEDQPELEVWANSERRGYTIGGASGLRAIRRELSEFVSTINSGGTPVFSVHDGYAVMSVIDAAYRSSRSGRPEEVDRHRDGSEAV